MAAIAAWAGLALAGFGTAVSTAGALKQGSADQKLGNYNASIAEKNAQTALEDASIAASQRRLAERRTIGSNKAIFGASGIDVNSGSPLQILVEQARQEEQDHLLILRSGQKDYEANMAAAESARMGGQAAQNASYYKAGSTLLTGGYQVASGINDIRVGRAAKNNPNPHPSPGK